MKDYKFYIIDDNKEIVDYSNNMLELRLTCSAMDTRVGGSCEVVSKKELDLIRSEVRNKLSISLPRYRAVMANESKTIEGSAILMDRFLVIDDGSPRVLYGGESKMDTKIIPIKKETIEMSFNGSWYLLEKLTKKLTEK